MRVSLTTALAALLAAGPLVAEGRDQRRGERPATKKADGKKLRVDPAHKAAVATLSATSSSQSFVRAIRVLRDGLPESRPLLHEPLRHGTRVARAAALRILADAGDGENDRGIAVEATRDRNAMVRKAALVTLRRFGPEGLDAVAALLRREPEAKVRKVAIKTLESWRDAKALAPLIDRLRIEKDAAVRKFLVSALCRISGQRAGDNLAAWERIEQERVDHLEAKRILSEDSAREDE